MVNTNSLEGILAASGQSKAPKPSNPLLTTQPNRATPPASITKPTPAPKAAKPAALATATANALGMNPQPRVSAPPASIAKPTKPATTAPAPRPVTTAPVARPVTTSPQNAPSPTQATIDAANAAKATTPPVTNYPVSENYDPMLIDGGGVEGPVATGTEGVAPVETAPEEVAAEPEWSLETDPIYMQALQEAQSLFNINRINALGGLQYQTTGINRELRNRIPEAEEQRRRLAGNFAARGMAGGRAGALARTEASANAREQGARNALREQIAELNRQYTGEFGAEGTDWTATRFGQNARENAIQRAMQLLIPRFTSVGA